MRFAVLLVVFSGHRIAPFQLNPTAKAAADCGNLTHFVPGWSFGEGQLQNRLQPSAVRSQFAYISNGR